MKKIARRVLAYVVLGSCLATFPGCSSLLFAHTDKESAESAKFRAGYPHLKELLRQNHFRQSIQWVHSWQAVQDLSGSDRALLRKDLRTIRMIGSAYYMGVAREREKIGRYRGALAALKNAELFTPEDPILRKKVQMAQARIIVRGESGQDWAVVVQKLLDLKERNPRDNTLDPMIGWSYAKLAGSEYTSGLLGLALRHATTSLSYDKSGNEAMRVKDRVRGVVNKLVLAAEIRYRSHRFDLVRSDLSKALAIDPDNKRARKDWRLLSETLKMPGVQSGSEKTGPSGIN